MSDDYYNTKETTKPVETYYYYPPRFWCLDQTYNVNVKLFFRDYDHLEVVGFEGIPLFSYCNNSFLKSPLKYFIMIISYLCSYVFFKKKIIMVGGKCGIFYLNHIINQVDALGVITAIEDVISYNKKVFAIKYWCEYINTFVSLTICFAN